MTPNLCTYGDRKRIHKEPGHEEDAYAQQNDGEMWEDSRIDWADIPTHRLNCWLLKQKSCMPFDGIHDIQSHFASIFAFVIIFIHASW